MDDHPEAPDCTDPCDQPEHFTRHLRETMDRLIGLDYAPAEPRAVIRFSAEAVDAIRVAVPVRDSHLDGHTVIGAVMDEIARLSRPPADPVDVLSSIRADIERIRSMDLLDPAEIRMTEATRDDLRDRLTAQGVLISPTAAEATRIYGLDVVLDPDVPPGTAYIGPRKPRLDDYLPRPFWQPPEEIRVSGDPRASLDIEDV